MSGAAPDPADAVRRAKLLKLAHSLRVEGRLDDAITLFEHLLTLSTDRAEALFGLVLALGAKGLTLEALNTLIAVKAAHPNPPALISIIREQSLPAVAKYNSHLHAGEFDQAEKYAAALASLVPQNIPMLNAALVCNQALGRRDQTQRYAKALLAVDPANVSALAALSEPAAPVDDAMERRIAQVLDQGGGQHPLIRLRDIHDVASAILCRPLTPQGVDQVERLLAAARTVVVDAAPGTEWAGWEKHYRLLLEGVDLKAVFAPTPAEAPEAEVKVATASGAMIGWDDVHATAARLGVEVVFFAAADETYVDLYARWYALSVLKYCDAPCLVVVHVIGGADRLAAIARSVGVDDERLIFCGDAFDAGAVTTKCYDSPPKGLIARPVAHFQSVRFQRLGALMRNLETPVFVSDIDLLLQRGVTDLLLRTADADIVFNENEVSENAGSRLTANLVLVRPTDNAARFLRFLRAFLDTALAGAEVTRWIDQLALVMARHHLAHAGQAPRLDYFDTTSDINNVMYPSYQAHPFRFLSLYHGFDTSSLEGDPRVLGETANEARKNGTRAAPRARKGGVKR